MRPIERAARAERTLSDHFADSSPEERLGGLLGDLRHLCDARGIDFAERDGLACSDYRAEVAGAGQTALAEIGGRRYALALVVEQLDDEDPWELLASVLLDRRVDGHQVHFIGDPRPIGEADHYDSDRVARAILGRAAEVGGERRRRRGPAEVERWETQR